MRQSAGCFGINYEHTKAAHTLQFMQSVTIMHCNWMMQAALRLTQAQQADMLHLRKLFCAKIGALRRERAGLWPKVPVEVAGTAADATIKTSATSSLAQQLQESSAAEFRATVQFGSAFDRGVGPVLVNLKQLAAAAACDESTMGICTQSPRYAVTLVKSCQNRQRFGSKIKLARPVTDCMLGNDKCKLTLPCIALRCSQHTF